MPWPRACSRPRAVVSRPAREHGCRKAGRPAFPRGKTGLPFVCGAVRDGLEEVEREALGEAEAERVLVLVADGDDRRVFGVADEAAVGGVGVEEPVGTEFVARRGGDADALEAAIGIVGAQAAAQRVGGADAEIGLGVVFRGEAGEGAGLQLEFRRRAGDQIGADLADDTLAAAEGVARGAVDLGILPLVAELDAGLVGGIDVAEAAQLIE